MKVFTETALGAVSHETLPNLVRDRNREGLQRFLGEMCPASSPFQACFVLDADGAELADVHGGQAYEEDIGKQLGWRDYFQGAKAPAGCTENNAYFSRDYHGSDTHYKTAIAVPILDQKKQFLGVLASSLTTKPKLGLAALSDPSYQVALLAPRDTDDPGAAPPSQENSYVVLFHPAYREGAPAVEVGSTDRFRITPAPVCASQLDPTSNSLPNEPDSNYQDPVASRYESYRGRWIAGFAPIGNTGFGVEVQKRYDQSVSLDSSTYRDLAIFSALISLVAIAMFGIVLWRWIHRPPSAERS